MSLRLFRVLIATAFLVGCGGKHAGTGTDLPSTSPTECPTAHEDSAGKVANEAYLRAHSDQTQTVTITLRSLTWANPACSNAETTAGCPDRDQALAEREAENVKQVECVLAAFGPAGSVPALQAVWYEPLEHPSTGAPTPIGTAFAVNAVWSQLEAVAQHPYVERIEPAFGQAAKLGVPAPAVPTECPPPNEVPDMKLLDAASIRGVGRMPVVIELKSALLPPLRSCAGEALCDDLFASGWERTVASRRQLTCVRSYIDGQLQAEAPEVEYGAVDGIPQGPKLPPFGESIHATLAFGLGLTWEEANEVAKHPDVERLWTSDALTFGVLPDGCPLDYDAPVPLPQCATDTQPITGKFTSADQAQWQQSGVPNEVLIAIRRDRELCPIPACPSRPNPCPERDRYEAYTTQEAGASQTCVRSLIASIGGSATDEVLVLGNSIDAFLSWSQIQTVAAHPDVISIGSRFGGPPP